MVGVVEFEVVDLAVELGVVELAVVVFDMANHELQSIETNGERVYSYLQIYTYHSSFLSRGGTSSWLRSGLQLLVLTRVGISKSIHSGSLIFRYMRN